MLARAAFVALLVGAGAAHAQSSSALGPGGGSPGSGSVSAGAQESGNTPRMTEQGSEGTGAVPGAISGGAPDNSSSTAHAGGSTTGHDNGMNSFQGPAGSQDSHGPSGVNKGPAQ